ncbi:ArnT family glycosyltransferase [Amycolatopsis sp. CA-230715]|uniref:ArnT family glycosyltransferase n=1 Tax=Amycolatopsis sp. CA-230715 TaxID=2745196 RepID=UPI001C333282|nr:glycosyltransferase family 39 protein [Amycolatopsis sp. CA-230715]QWF78537.1 hypothetical protein HUW46_01933 [Amycolatopsis sp. CA-230715]
MTATLGTTPVRTDPAPPALPALARGPVWTLAGALGMVLLLTSGHYGYFGDELYYLSAGKHLAWGYADQPPLVPLLASLMDSLFPGQVAGFRLPATVITALGTVVVALLAREFGGGRRAQVLAAATYTVSLGTLWTGHLLTTPTLDVVLWAVIVLLVVRWVRLDRAGVRADRLLLWAGLVTAVDLQVKYLVPVLWIGLAVGMLAVGPRRMLTRPLLWAGAAITVVTIIPAMLWQAANGWPQLEMTDQISHEISGGTGFAGKLVNAPVILLWAGVLVGTVLLGYGCWRLLRSPALRPYRFLAIAALVVVVVFVVSGGRPYYSAGIFAPLWAAAAVEIEQGEPAKWWRWVTTWPVFAVSGLLAAALTLPVLPASTVSPTDEFLSKPGSVGWPELAGDVASVYRGLPPDERRKAILIGEDYWQASALEHYGEPLGLPAAYSPNRGFWYFGAPPDDKTVALYVTAFPQALPALFDNVRKAATIDNPNGVPTSNNGVSVYVVSGPKVPWSTLWPHLRRM